ncbi:VQ motif-containing protein 4-like [Cynara cardunculus var. scolymus]|uniref:VQ-like protein n=1 Tax=Cynara cardunculus var. scolymus TaxID=59895 RepID=A0A124SHS4_CYNCS|nr:VQ motif-containing protein 4-like [Cynara cardunculus var. scolymus]KVI10468.1 VQ-like protein [Cynara cardunculus var. scolymus]
MEIVSRQHDTENPSPANSPSSNGSSSNSNGHAAAAGGGAAIQTPPLTPRPVSRSEPNPYPTTFVQADTTSFKQVVQMLTGSSKPTQQPDPTPSKISIPPIKTGQQKKQGFKLYERRNSLKNGLMINPSVPKFGHGHGLSPRIHEILSPSILDFPSLVLSPVTPLIEDPFNKSSPSIGNSSEEERVIAQKGFYLHPSPRAATPHGTAEPQLLPLFPVTSPRVSESSI